MLHASPVTGIEKEFVVPGAKETVVEVESEAPYVKLTFVIVRFPEYIEPLNVALSTPTGVALTVLTFGLHESILKYD